MSPSRATTDLFARFAKSEMKSLIIIRLRVCILKKMKMNTLYKIIFIIDHFFRYLHFNKKTKTKQKPKTFNTEINL